MEPVSCCEHNIVLNMFLLKWGGAILKRIRNMLSGVSLVDVVLVLFMMVLLAYLTAHLFTGIEPDKESNSIDIIVRTSAAGVFGYFISRNFGREVRKTSSGSTSAVSRQTIDAATSSPIGFRAQSPSDPEQGTLNTVDPSAEVTEYADTVQAAAQCDRMQVLIVSAIGLFSLIVLLIARQFYSTAGEFTAIVSQLRDFLSASIGFLISCGNNLSD